MAFWRLTSWRNFDVIWAEEEDKEEEVYDNLTESNSTT